MAEATEHDQQSTVQKPTIDLLHGRIAVTVTVGQDAEEKSWVLPKNLLAQISPFFNACINGVWSTTVANEIKLQDDKPAVFEWFVRWLYIWTTNSSDECQFFVEIDLDPIMSLDGWVLGDKLGCPRFQDYAIAHLYYCEVPEPDIFDFVSLVYAATPDGSSIRRWIATQLLEEVEDYPCKNARLVDLAEQIDGLAVDLVKVRTLLNGPRDLSPFLIVSASSGFFTDSGNMAWEDWESDAEHDEEYDTSDAPEGGW
ncbi:MAG: hypothetical protein Q9212_004083 [Teloschistes hypoglaucus]